MALSGLLSMVMLFVDVQPLVASDCPNNANGDAVQIHRLEHATPVTLDYQPGQSAMLSGNEAGNAKLAGRSVVGVEFAPSGQMIGYGVETLPPIDVTPLLALGTNTVSLTAVDPQDRAWLRITSPCPVSPTSTAESPDSRVQPSLTPTSAPTATRVLIPTATPTDAEISAIITPTLAVRHSSDRPDSTNSRSPAAVETPVVTPVSMQGVLLRLLVGLLLVMGVLLALMQGDVRRLWQALRQRVQTVDAALLLRRLRAGWQWLLRMKREWLG